MIKLNKNMKAYAGMEPEYIFQHLNYILFGYLFTLYFKPVGLNQLIHS